MGIVFVAKEGKKEKLTRAIERGKRPVCKIIGSPRTSYYYGSLLFLTFFGAINSLF